MVSYRFGFLRQKAAYSFVGGKIVPVPEFEVNKKSIASWAHRDGFLYPPIGWSEEEDGKPVPNSKRPVHLHRLPASHQVDIERNASAEDRRRTDANFIIQLIAYLRGTWLQFEDWFFDARVPLDGKHNICHASKTAEHFISHAYQEWQKWPENAKPRFVTTLWMLNRAPSYQWDWEHFVVEYMVLDACWRSAEDLKLVCGRVAHKDRINRLCEIFNIQQNVDLVAEIVRLRNDLFHESLWDKCQPGTASSAGSFHAPLNLRRLNQRLILALLDYKNDYMRSCWWSMGTCIFGIP